MFQNCFVLLFSEHWRWADGSEKNNHNHSNFLLSKWHRLCVVFRYKVSIVKSVHIRYYAGNGSFKPEEKLYRWSLTDSWKAQNKTKQTANIWSNAFSVIIAVFGWRSLVPLSYATYATLNYVEFYRIRRNGKTFAIGRKCKTIIQITLYKFILVYHYDT